MNKNMFKRNNKVITSVFLIVFMAWMLFISVHSKQEQLQNNKTVFGFFFEETDADKVIDKIGRKNIYAIGKNTVITKEQVKKYQDFYNTMDVNAAREKAIRYAEERNALYVAAIQNKYFVSDEEVWKNIRKMQNEYIELNTQNNEPREITKSDFNNYKIDLSIQKYVKNAEKTYSIDFENLKKKVVIGQEYKVVNP